MKIIDTEKKHVNFIEEMVATTINVEMSLFELYTLVAQYGTTFDSKVKDNMIQVAANNVVTDINGQQFLTDLEKMKASEIGDNADYTKARLVLFGQLEKLGIKNCL